MVTVRNETMYKESNRINMRTQYMMLALMALCLASCTKEEEENIVAGNLHQEVRVSAGMGSHSRLVLNEKGRYTQSLWQDGDKITLFTDTQSNLVYSTTLEADSTAAEFTYTDEALNYVEGDTVYACYPDCTVAVEDSLVVSLPSTATIEYNGGTLRSFCYGMDQISDGAVHFKFKHISAFICLSVTPEMLVDSTQAISKVTVSTSSEVPLSVGEGDRFNFYTLQAETTHGTNQVQVNTGNLMVDSLWTVYIPVLPQPAEAQITITLTDAQGTAQYTLTKQAPTTGFQAGNVYQIGASASKGVAYLAMGYTFNKRIKQWVANDESRTEDDTDYDIYSIEFKTGVETLPEEYTTVSADDSPHPIYASYSSSDGLLTVFTPAPKIEIENAAGMFQYLRDLESIEFNDFRINETTTNMGNMFAGCYSLASLDVTDWNTKNVTVMSGMFYDCKQLTTLDLSGWDVTNVNHMRRMFAECSSLETLNTAHWDAENVINMREMFAYCTSMTTLNVSDWDADRVVIMSDMFNGCSALTSLDISKWDLGNVTHMDGMFRGCSALIALDAANWDVSHVQTMQRMFSECSSLGTLAVTNWEVANVRDMTYMFDECSSLASLDVAGWDLGNVNIGAMFRNCSSLTSLDVSEWNTSSVSNMEETFSGCSALTSLDVSNWITENVRYMNETFRGCSALTTLDVSNWSVSHIYGMEYMFDGCSSLTTLDVSNWTIDDTDMDGMFRNCSSLTTLDVSNWGMYYVYSMNELFSGCTSLKTLDVSNWTLENTRYMSNLFNGCTSLAALDVSNWNTSYVYNMSNLFKGCAALTTLNVSNWNTAYASNMGGMFSGCTGLTALDLSNWNLSNVSDMSRMFENCSSLDSLDITFWRLRDGVSYENMFDGCASVSQDCEITTVKAVQDFLLERVETTLMNTEWFNWDILPNHVYEKMILKELYASMNGDKWTNHTNWNSDLPLGEWYGITTDEAGQVVSIDLSNNNLTGSVSINLKDFSSLKSINLDNNKMQVLQIEGNAHVDSIALNNPTTSQIYVRDFKHVEINCAKLRSIGGYCESLKVSNCDFGDYSSPFSGIEVKDAIIYNCKMYSCGLNSETLRFESSRTNDTWHCHTTKKLSVINSYCSTICSDFYSDTIIELVNATLWRSNWDESSTITVTRTITGAEWYSLFEEEEEGNEGGGIVEGE